MSDDFRGDNAHLVECIRALISLSDDGAIKPHGLGGHARTLLSAAASRLAAPAMTSDEREKGLTHDEREAMDWLDTFKDRIPKASEWDGYKTRIGLVCDALRVLGADRLAASGGDKSKPFTHSIRCPQFNKPCTCEASPPPAAEQEAVAWQVSHMTARNPPNDWTPWSECPKWEHDSIVQNQPKYTRTRPLYAHPPAAALGEDARRAYEGAREDLLDWKQRALRAEGRLRKLGWEGIEASVPPAESEPEQQTVTEAMVERACMALWPDEAKFMINPILRERNAPAIRKALLAALGRGEGS